MNLDVHRGVATRFHAKGFTVCESEGDLREHRAADHVLSTGWVHRVKAHRGKQKPCRHLTTIVVAVQTARCLVVLLCRNLPHLRLSLPRLAPEIIEISVVMARLVAV